MKTFWLIVMAYSFEGDMLSKTPYETASYQQCIDTAAEVSKEYVNTQTMVSLFCVSDEEYRKTIIKE